MARLLRGFDAPPLLRLWDDTVVAPQGRAATFTLEFESGGTGIYQILASRRDRGRWPVPMSRRDLYAAPGGPA
ncbi:hypothetical protein [Polaromonas sp. C04]|uniref:hypothetical protein n=1 Tax=Polaromonas sp. C04 TaxID=1945857 RepID=UPI0009CFF5FE|nr:hypothetical protein [Polaromonas sp. C04]OOG55385.1 hypothetical protein B0E49_07990 [Polaromonas sp. C04]